MLRAHSTVLFHRETRDSVLWYRVCVCVGLGLPRLHTVTRPKHGLPDAKLLFNYYNVQPTAIRSVVVYVCTREGIYVLYLRRSVWEVGTGHLQHSTCDTPPTVLLLTSRCMLKASALALERHTGDQRCVASSPAVFGRLSEHRLDRVTYRSRMDVGCCI